MKLVVQLAAVAVIVAPLLIVWLIEAFQAFRQRKEVANGPIEDGPREA